MGRAVVDRSNKLGVDLIAITGDLIDGSLDARRADIEPLRDLKAPDGVYVISGNHEYIFGYSTWMAHFAALGLLSLENRHIVLDRDDGKLVLAGITDRASRRTGTPPETLPQSSKALPKASLSSCLITSRATRIRRGARRGLRLSGHTHGGLVLGIDGWPHAPTPATSRVATTWTG